MAQKRMTMLASNAYSRLNLLATGAMTDQFWNLTRDDMGMYTEKATKIGEGNKHLVIKKSTILSNRILYFYELLCMITIHTSLSSAW
jgi:hypothetical protein